MTEEERQVAASRMEEREALREKAAEVAVPRMLCALIGADPGKEEEGSEDEAEDKDWRMTLRRKKLKAFFDRG